MSPRQDVVDTAPEQPDYAEMEQRATELREVMAAPSAKETAAAELQKIEQALATRREDEGIAAAKARLTGIKRASGSLVDEYGVSVETVRSLIDELRNAVSRVNTLATRIHGYRDEAAALCDRFDLPLPALPRLAMPDASLAVTVPAFWEHIMPPPPALEQNDDGIRQRRSYDEVQGTESFDIITAAGLRAWLPLTQFQAARLADKRRDGAETKKALASFAADAALEMATGGRGGKVSRG